MFAATVALCAMIAAGPETPRAQAIAKGLTDATLETTSDADTRAKLISEVGTRLGARWVRLTVDWSAVEATRGTYDADEVQHLDDLVDGFHALGVKVILTTCYVPKWAQQQYWWQHPPSGYSTGPQVFYPVADDALADYGNLGEYLATHFEGRVQALECWNEPNLWPYIYPQRTSDDPYFAARVYARMLRAFHAGVERAGTGVKVVAGATAPIGLNDKLRTSPQRFARFLKSCGAGRWFDVYSHHPYTPGGTINAAPGQRPNDTSTTVTLYNLGQLLRLFPGKPFYLTEHGYNTRFSLAFGGFCVSKTTQARYLKSAYAYAARYPRVKLLLWYLLSDSRPATVSADYGVYTGLRTVSGSRKPAWYAFKNLGR